MPSLRELQRSFSAAVLFDDAAAAASLGIVPGSLGTAARIAIYRNNVLGNYRKALAATYPVVQRLVGGPFFNAAVEAFVRAYPSVRCDINQYGGELALFLAAYPPARELRYLPDVARLEWAIDQSNLAPDAAPFDVSALATVPSASFAELRFVLHPSARLIESRYPIFHIWRANQRDFAGNDEINLGEGSDAVLIVRRQADVSVERLHPGERTMLAAMAAKENFAAIAERTAEADPALDLSDALRRRVADGTIVSFRLPPTHRAGILT